MAIDTREEAIYYQAEKNKAAKKLLSEGVDEIIMLMLRKAFTEGYKAKEDYDEAQKVFIKEKEVGKK